MKLKSIYGIFFLASAVLQSCESPFELELPVTPSVGVAATFTPTDEGFMAFISPATSLAEPLPGELIDNAVVRVFTGTNLVDTLALAIQGSTSRRLFWSEVHPVTGVNYTLVVDVPGYPRMQANDMLPKKANGRLIHAVLKDKKVMPSGQIECDLDVEIGINSELGGTGYYHLFVEGRWRDTNGPVNSFFTLGELINADNHRPELTPYLLNQSFLITLDPMDIEEKKFKFQVSVLIPAGTELDNIIMDLRAVSTNYFQFHKTHAAQISSAGQGITEPSPLFSNFNIGHGFFGGYHAQRDTISF